MVFLYKVLFEFTSPYLMKNFVIKDNPNHNLRCCKPNFLTEKKCRIMSYKNSFIPSSISRWNSMPNEITNASSLNIFKSNLKIYLKIEKSKVKPYIVYHTHPGFFGKFLSQLRFNLSPLREHVFKYNITDNPFCPTCGDHIETIKHFFF